MIPLWFVLIACCVTTVASGPQPYDLAVNETAQFLVEGDPVISQREGSVDIDVVPVGAGFTLVKIHCASSATGRCRGDVAGQ